MCDGVIMGLKTRIVNRILKEPETEHVYDNCNKSPGKEGFRRRIGPH